MRVARLFLFASIPSYIPAQSAISPTLPAIEKALVFRLITQFAFLVITLV